MKAASSAMPRTAAIAIMLLLCAAAPATAREGDADRAIELRELVVSSSRRKLLHMLAYVREYSTLSTMTDTIALFREKMVDFMLPTEKKLRFDHWTTPRILCSRSYYRFSNSAGLDSVSDRCNQHFSWADWLGVPPAATMPAALLGSADGACVRDTLRGRYGAAEMWEKSAGGDSIILRVDVLADTTARRWVPAMGHFFRRGVDFDRFRVDYRYENLGTELLAPVNLDEYSFEIESNGRGHNMFMFNRVDENFCVSTKAEVYIVDREYVGLKEARKWLDVKSLSTDMAIYEPAWVPAVSPAMQALVERVEAIDHENVRLDFTADARLGHTRVKLNFGQAVLSRLKGMLGIDALRGEHKQKKRWKEFRNERKEKNRRRNSDA